MTTKTRLTWQQWKDLDVTWTRRKLGAGSKDGRCDDHGRQTVWIASPDHGFIDTGLCASDLNRLERMSKTMKEMTA